MINPEQTDYTNTPAAPARPSFHYRSAEAISKPTVTIITPFYNTDSVFRETARSVFAQSLQDFEWLIVDDGSSDSGALAMLLEIQDSDPRVKVITQQNGGPSAARNTAFQHSIGRYLCLLDSDDMIEPTFIEKCLWFLESNPEFGFCNSWSVNFGDENFLWTIGFERGKAHLDANSGPPISVIRRAVFEAGGGFDESIRFGHEDWDFWLSVANAGYWGHTLPEYLEWYRKRTSGRYQQIMQTASVNKEFEALIANKYRGLPQRFPTPTIRPPEAYETVADDLPFENILSRPGNTQGILFLVPWMVTGGADKVNLDWVAALSGSGYQVTICATLDANHQWLSEFSKLTPDIFALPNFLRCADYPRFLRYLIASRGIGTVLITGSTFGYLVSPYLRAHFPNVTFVDLCHVEEPHWMNGGHPRFALGYQEILDLNLVTTASLRTWMIGRGGDPTRIAVCHSGIDVSKLDSSPSAKMRARDTLSLLPDVPVVVFAGRICEQKRPLLLADILQGLVARGAEFQALIIGDGELRQALESRLEEFGLFPRVRMLGTLGHDAWLQALAAADVFLLPSMYEGISVALLEAMGMAVVPVTAAVGGQDEAVGNDCGVLVPRSEHELDSYVEAVSRLLSDNTSRYAMGQAARKKIFEEFSLQASTNGLLTALARARVLAVTAPRRPIASGFARELATLAVEYTRLTGVAGFLWNHWVKTGTDGGSPVPAVSTNSVMRLVSLLAATRIGGAVLRSRKLRALARWLLARLEARKR